MERRDFIKTVGIGTSAAVIGCGDKSGCSGNEPILGRTELISLSGITSIHEHVDSVEAGEKLIEAMDAVGIARANLLGAYTTLLQSKKLDWSSGAPNNDVLAKLTKEHPDRFTMFPLMDGAEEDVAGSLERYLEQGALGIKMYNGVGGKYRRMSLTDKRLRPLYETCALHGVPILIHVDVKRLKEYLRIVEDYPSIPWICPHLFALTKPSQIDRMEQIFRRYPNIYTDQSFGFEKWMDTSLKRLSESRDRVRKIFIEYSERILFGTDIVFALSSKHRTVEWASNSIREYRKFLEYDNFEHNVQGRKKLYTGQLKGLALPDDVLQRIYVDNAKAILDGPNIEFQDDALRNVSTSLPVGYEINEDGAYELLAVGAVANLSEITSTSIGSEAGPGKIGCFEPLLTSAAMKLEIPPESLTSYGGTAELIEATAQDESMLAIVPFDALEPRLKAMPIDGFDPTGPQGIERCGVHRSGSKENYFGDYPLLFSFALPGESRLGDAQFRPFELRTVLLTGSSLLGRGMLETSIAEPYDSVSKMSPMCQRADVTHLSVENVIKTTCEQDLKRWNFCYESKWLNVLDYLGVDVLDLTGNHIGDWKQEPLKYTIEKYRSAGIPLFGGGTDLGNALKPAVVTCRGKRIGFAGINRLNSGKSVASKGRAGPLTGLSNFDEAIKRVNENSDVFFVTYQGGYEFSPRPWNDMLRLANRAIKAGAVAVAGIHSHMPMGVEVSGGSFVAYGLGNFYFRHPETTIPNRPMTERGAILKSTLYGDKLVQSILVPVRMDNGVLAPANIEDAKMVFRRVKNASKDGLAPTRPCTVYSDAMVELDKPKRITSVWKAQMKLGVDHVLVGMDPKAAKKLGSASSVIKQFEEVKRIHAGRGGIPPKMALTLLPGWSVPTGDFDAVRIYVDRYSSELRKQLDAVMMCGKPLQLVFKSDKDFRSIVEAVNDCAHQVILSGLPRFARHRDALSNFLDANNNLLVDTSANNEKEMANWFASLSSERDVWREFWGSHSDRMLMASGATSSRKRYGWSQRSRMIRALKDVMTEEVYHEPIWSRGNKGEWSGYKYEDEPTRNGLALTSKQIDAVVYDNFLRIF